jgi:hypothetical protein
MILIILTHVWQPNDAKGLNGKFRVESTKAKRKFLLAWGSPKFEPRDIIPLVNKAFQVNFAIQKDVQKAIARRGWSPLNYKLLENFQSPTGSAALCSSVTPSLNVTHGSASIYLDLLVEESKKDEGRKWWNEELKAMLKRKEQKLNHIKTIGKVSSARLAANNHNLLE